MSAPGSLPISPVTIITPIPRWWAFWLKMTWKLADRSAWVKGPLLRLGFIHVAHWGVVWRAGPRHRLPTPYLVFATNFDGPALPYIEAFSIVVPGRLRGMLWGCYTFPGPRPVNEFVAWVFDEACDGPIHYYAAYPDETVLTIRSALGLESAFDRLRGEVDPSDPPECAERWYAFVARNERDL
jgi:hypothetical protein